MEKVRWISVYVNFLRILPVYFCWRFNRFHEKCEKDLEAWVMYEPALNERGHFWQLGYLLIYEKACRNILQNRLHRNPLLFAVTRGLFKPLESCYINMPPEKIGGGFSMQHGFSTIVAANEIGENCRIYQQVTVGYRGEFSPVIGDDVTIAAGAIVIGGIRIGNDAIVGAGAVVINDVADKTTVVGVPAREI